MIGAQVQKALFDALVAANVCGGRVHDRVPEKPVFPYATLGDDEVQDQSNTCNPAWDVIANVAVHSRPSAASKAEVKSEAAKTVDAVLALASVDGFALSRVDFIGSTTRRDQDGLTEVSICVFRVCVDPVS